MASSRTPRERRTRTPLWVQQLNFLVVMAVLAFARPNPVVTVVLGWVALAVSGWDGPWPTWLRDKDPPTD